MSNYATTQLKATNPITPLYKYQTFFGMSSKIKYT